MRQLVGIEEGLSLFLLEDEGILFSEGQQELYALNTPAAYVWCCLEEGMTPHQISGAFSSSFDVPVEQAAQATGDLLARWQASGYIRGVPDTAHSEIDWTTAQRLMASPSLREDFADSPFETLPRSCGLPPTPTAGRSCRFSTRHWSPKRSGCRR